MGDHRASIKIEFEMHGHKAKTDMWINWFVDDHSGVDQRVIDWLAAHARKAMDKYAEAEYEAQQEPARRHLRDVLENGT